MAYPAPTHCPACSEVLEVTELTCPRCATRVQGVFTASRLSRLTVDQLNFVEVFLRCRGNIREVERDLKISYPTVRTRLDQILQAMGLSDAPAEWPAAADTSGPTTDVLEALDAGNLSFEEALARLRGKERL
ncbi:MAG: DUF2089 domain-containing protein [Alicyclobacillus sp.]|nr:DUF2089 domain-containing protein [Alicyclobacillus sp.]